MKVKELITCLLDEDMDEEVYMMIGDYRGTGTTYQGSQVDGLIEDTSGRVLLTCIDALMR